eukprot:scaffold125423_cov31-Tisochrysis_lutea.AAC.2
MGRRLVPTPPGTDAPPSAATNISSKNFFKCGCHVGWWFAPTSTRPKLTKRSQPVPPCLHNAGDALKTPASSITPAASSGQSASHSYGAVRAVGLMRRHNP